MSEKKPPLTEKQKLEAEVAHWRKAWHEARTATGKAWWDGYRAGNKARKKIGNMEDPLPYLKK